MILFINRTNNCYLISVIQALLSIPILVNFLKNSDEESEIVTLFSNLINQLRDSNKNLIESNSIIRILGKYDSFFNGRNQEDAHECLIRLFDILTKEYKNKGIRNKFNIHFKTTVTCNKCDYLSINQFTDYSIILNFKTQHNNKNNKNRHNLAELFEDYIRIEEVNAKCEKCRSGKISKCTRIVKLPQVLVVVFSKFNQLASSVEVSKKININLNNVDYFYNLISKINHTGNLNSGHYTADRLINGKWFNLNDDTIHEIKNEPRYDSKCYIAIYNLK